MMNGQTLVGFTDALAVRDVHSVSLTFYVVFCDLCVKKIVIMIGLREAYYIDFEFHVSCILEIILKLALCLLHSERDK